MRWIYLRLVAGLLIVLGLLTPRTASGETETSAASEIQELKARVTKLEEAAAQPSPLTDQVTQMQLQQSLPDPLGSGFTGLGPAASKIYTSRNPVAIGAVAELTYASISHTANSTNIANANVLLGARLSKRLVFNSSFSLESKSNNQTSGTTLQYAYVDFLFGDERGVRIGNLLVPFGVTNLRFEPTLYPTVNRPIADQIVIPTDWNENGVLAFDRTETLTWQAGLVDAGDISNAASGSWLRSARQAGQMAKADSIAWIARVETNSSRLPGGRPRPSVGVSLYGGSWSQGDHARFGNAEVLMGEAHGGFNAGRFKMEALYVEGHLSDAAQISTVLARGIAARVRGATATLSFDLLPPVEQRAATLLGVDSSPFYHELPIFVSYEMADAQADLPAGFTADPDSRASIWTFGINYLPHEQFVIKGDFALKYDRANAETRSVEAALGVTF